jgi:hypothetical protein
MAGQPHPPDRRPKKVRVFLGTAPKHTPICHPHPHAGYMIAKAAIDVVILAVNVGCDHTAQSDKLRSWRHWDEKETRQKESVQFE